MKITRRQLRRIIKEAIDPNADQEEAAYAVAYTSGYLSASDADFGEILRKNKNLSSKNIIANIVLNTGISDKNIPALLAPMIDTALDQQ